MSSLKDTIVAISTALDESAISIVRISGMEALEIVQKVFSKDLSNTKSFSGRYGKIIEPTTQRVMDEVIVNVFLAPHTYTCEDIVEINCHGGKLVTQEILTLLMAQGARMANPGEFTQRAFLNGRIDLSQAEATLQMIEAPTHQATRLAAAGIGGSVKRLIEPLTTHLMDIIAHIETNIDYPEYYDIEQLTHETVLPMCKTLMKQMEPILSRAQTTQLLKDGVKTVILGKPNVGKSSLLNALLDEEKAIVTDIAGTTRDLVEGWVRLENVTLHLIDTAGLRETEDIVEKIGIDKTREMLKKAQLAIIVLDSSQPLDAQDEWILEETKSIDRLIVHNKADLIQENEDGIYVSAIHQQIDHLLDALNSKYQDAQKSLEAPSLGNERQMALMRQAQDDLARAIDALENDIELDLVNIDLTGCFNKLTNIIQPSGEVNLMSEIFSRFCLGK